MTTIKMAEYRVERNHREHLLDIVEFQGIVEDTTPSPKKINIVQIDMNEVAQMKIERDAKLESGSFWK